MIGFLVIGHLGRGAKAMARAEALDGEERYGKAMDAYKRVLAIEGGSTRGMLARQRIDEIEALVQRREEEGLYLSEVRAAEQRANAGPSALAAAVEKLEKLSRESAIALQVASKPLRKLRERLETRAAKELAKRKSEAGDFLAKREYANAMKLFQEFPSWCGRTTSWGEAEAEAADIEERARRESGEAFSRAEALLNELATRPSALGEAQSLLSPFIRRTGMKEIEDAARALRDRIKARAREVRGAATARVERARLAEAETFARRCRLLQHGYHFKAARTLARRAQSRLREQGTFERAEELDGRVEAIIRSENLFDKLLARIAAAQLKAHSIEVPAGPRGRVIKGRVIGARKKTDELVMRTESGPEARIDWGRLPAAEILKLFRAMPLEPADRLTIAEFCLEHGLLAEARRELIYTTRVGPQHRELALALLARARNTSAVRSPDEEDAATLAEFALVEATAGRVGEARKAHLLLTTRYAATAVSGAARVSIEQAIRAAGGGD